MVCVHASCKGSDFWVCKLWMLNPKKLQVPVSTYHKHRRPPDLGPQESVLLCFGFSPLAVICNPNSLWCTLHPTHSALFIYISRSTWDIVRVYPCWCHVLVIKQIIHDELTCYTKIFWKHLFCLWIYESNFPKGSKTAGSLFAPSAGTTVFLLRWGHQSSWISAKLAPEESENMGIMSAVLEGETLVGTSFMFLLQSCSTSTRPLASQNWERCLH